MASPYQLLTIRPSRQSRRKADVEFLVDSGAVYSVVPAATLRKLGLRPYRRETFTLADGRNVQRKVGDAYFELNGHRGPAPVIFGEKGDEPLLGLTTLESLGLALDPFKRELLPMRMMLMKSGRTLTAAVQKAVLDRRRRASLNFQPLQTSALQLDYRLLSL